MIAEFDFIGGRRKSKKIRLDGSGGFNGPNLTTNYSYDGAGRPTKIQQSSPTGNAGMMDIRYDREGHQIAIAQAKSGDGMAGLSLVTDDKLYRVTQFETHVAGSISNFANNTATPVTGFSTASSYYESFAYDKAGNRTSAQRGQVTETYAKTGANAQRNRYDSVSYVEGGNSLGTANLSYDDKGAALGYSGAREDTSGNWTDREETRVFDHADRLVQWRNLIGYTSDPEPQPIYRESNSIYDPLGRRVRKEVCDHSPGNDTSIAEIDYAHAGASVVSEYSSIGQGRTLDKEFVYGGLDEPLRMSDASGTAATAQFFTMNSSGSVLGTHSTTGARTEGYEYRCFGTTAIHDGSGVAVTSVAGNVGNPYRFHGRRAEFEEQSPLYFHRTRHYEPDLGRFVGHDKPGDWYDGANLGNGLAYCHNDPVNFVDPFGLATIHEVGEPQPVEMNGDGLSPSGREPWWVRKRRMDVAWARATWRHFQRLAADPVATEMIRLTNDANDRLFIANSAIAVGEVGLFIVTGGLGTAAVATTLSSHGLGTAVVGTALYGAGSSGVFYLAKEGSLSLATGENRLKADDAIAYTVGGAIGGAIDVALMRAYTPLMQAQATNAEQLFVHLRPDQYDSVVSSGFLGRGYQGPAKALLPPFDEGRIWATAYSREQLGGVKGTFFCITEGINPIEFRLRTKTIAITGEAAAAFTRP